MGNPKKYRRRRYDDTFIIYTTTEGAICQTSDEEDSKLVLDALNFYEEQHAANPLESVTDEKSN